MSDSRMVIQATEAYPDSKSKIPRPSEAASAPFLAPKISTPTIPPEHCLDGQIDSQKEYE